MAGPTSDVDESTLSDLEKTAIKYSSKWQETGRAYAMEHSSRPATIGHVLSSSPLALLAWCVHIPVRFCTLIPIHVNPCLRCRFFSL
jgi:hypothetical protein